MRMDVLDRIRRAETLPLDHGGKVAMWHTLQDAAAEIKRLRGGGWISVLERLPPENQHVVVWDSDNKIAVVAYRFKGENYLMNAGDGYGFTEYAVSHWMPLPEPPEVTK